MSQYELRHGYGIVRALMFIDGIVDGIFACNRVRLFYSRQVADGRNRNIVFVASDCAALACRAKCAAILDRWDRHCLLGARLFDAPFGQTH